MRKANQGKQIAANVSGDNNGITVYNLKAIAVSELQSVLNQIRCWPKSPRW